MNFRKNSKGITLIALVVTIIVLLILAGVTLSLVAGSDGILGKATNAVDKNNEAQIAEEVELAMAELQKEYYMEKYVNKTGDATSKTYGEYAKAELEKTNGVKTSKGKLTLSEGTVAYTPNDANGKTLTGTFNATTGVVKIGGATTGGSDPTPQEPQEPQEPETPNEPETPSIPEGLVVGKEVTYTPSGTYADWTTDHSGSSSYNYSLASGKAYNSKDTTLTDMTISNWKVFKINESTGEVQLVPDGKKETTQKLGIIRSNRI